MAIASPPDPPDGFRPHQEPRPPADRRPVLDIVRAPVAGISTFTILSPDVYGFFLHYVGRKTLPCRNDRPLTCALCLSGIGRRWAGFLGVMDDRGLPFILQLSEGAARHCERLDISAGDLRGRRIALSRLKAFKQGAVKAVVERYPSQRELPPEPDVVAALCRKWGLPANAAPPAQGGE